MRIFKWEIWKEGIAVNFVKSSHLDNPLHELNYKRREYYDNAKIKFEVEYDLKEKKRKLEFGKCIMIIVC